MNKIGLVGLNFSTEDIKNRHYCPIENCLQSFSYKRELQNYKSTTKVKTIINVKNAQKHLHGPRTIKITNINIGLIKK